MLEYALTLALSPVGAIAGGDRFQPRRAQPACFSNTARAGWLRAARLEAVVLLDERGQIHVNTCIMYARIYARLAILI